MVCFVRCFIFLFLVSFVGVFSFILAPFLCTYRRDRVVLRRGPDQRPLPIPRGPGENHRPAATAASGSRPTSALCTASASSVRWVAGVRRSLRVLRSSNWPATGRTTPRGTCRAHLRRLVGRQAHRGALVGQRCAGTSSSAPLVVSSRSKLDVRTVPAARRRPGRSHRSSKPPSRHPSRRSRAHPESHPQANLP